MARTINQKRYSEAFKRKLLEEIKKGVWSTPYAAGKAYNIRSITVSRWMDEGGLTYLRGRTMAVKTLNEVSELQRLRKENKKLKEQLLDEILCHRIEPFAFISLPPNVSGEAAVSRRLHRLVRVSIILQPSSTLPV